MMLFICFVRVVFDLEEMSKLPFDRSDGIKKVFFYQCFVSSVQKCPTARLAEGQVQHI